MCLETCNLFFYVNMILEIICLFCICNHVNSIVTMV